MILEDELPRIALDAADEKNREGNELPLRADLAEDLRLWLDDKLERLQEEARTTKISIPKKLPGDSLPFDVPDGLLRIFNRDRKAAQIPKRDERGRTLDVHALRTTLATHLNRGKVGQRVAQAAMRHSRPELTAKTYTDEKLLDVREALSVLPSLPLTPRGSDNLPPFLPPTTGTEGEEMAISGKKPALAEESHHARTGSQKMT
jgi:integrase